MPSYYQKIKGDWDWEAMADDAREAERLGETDRDDIVNEDGEYVMRFYLGSLINPSGKYYTPFACGNVDACPICHGTGDVTSKLTAKQVRDYERITKREQALTSFALNIYGDFLQWPTKLLNRIKRLREMQAKRTSARTCDYCGGFGTREGFLDQCFWDDLDKVAEEYGGCIISGDGAPCDTFFVIPLDITQEGDE